MARLDRAVDTMLAKASPSKSTSTPRSAYKQAVKNDNEGVERFVMFWRRLAAHYANRDPEKSSSRS